MKSKHAHLDPKYRYQRHGKDEARLGSAVIDLASLNQHQTAAETTEEMAIRYKANIIECADEGKKKYKDPFYVVALRKKLHVAEQYGNVLDGKYVARQTKPEIGFMLAYFPSWDFELYEVNSKNGSLDLIYALPSQDMWPRILLHPQEAPEQTIKWIKLAQKYMSDAINFE
jgi:hypothetical protein